MCQLSHLSSTDPFFPRSYPRSVVPANPSWTPCVQGTSASLEQALRGLADYDAVGVMERQEDSIKLLESVLPRCFDEFRRL